MLCDNRTNLVFEDYFTVCDFSVDEFRKIIDSEDEEFRSWYNKKFRIGVAKCRTTMKIKFKWFKFYNVPKYKTELEAIQAFMKTNDYHAILMLRKAQLVRMIILNKLLDDCQKSSKNVSLTLKEIKELELEQHLSKAKITIS